MDSTELADCHTLRAAFPEKLGIFIIDHHSLPANQHKVKKPDKQKVHTRQQII